jgi:hypothetical protein
MNKTKIAWFAAIGGLLAYEVWTLTNKIQEDTLSEEVWRSIPRRPLVSLAAGMVIGHFFWQSQDVYDREIKREFQDGTTVTEKTTIKESGDSRGGTNNSIIPPVKS